MSSVLIDPPSGAPPRGRPTYRATCGMERVRVANVWDCIAVHASIALARHRRQVGSSLTIWANLCVSNTSLHMGALGDVRRGEVVGSGRAGETHQHLNDGPQ